MEIAKRISVLLIMLLFAFNYIDVVKVSAATIESWGIVEGEIETDSGRINYCESITSRRTETGPFEVENQGYRISLLEANTHVGEDIADCDVPIRCILDLVNSNTDPTYLTEACTASYGFKNNKRYDLYNATIRHIFTGEYLLDVYFENYDYKDLVGMNNTICNSIDKIQGYSKLTYMHSYDRFDGLDANGFHGNICDNRHVITKNKLSDAGYTITNNDDFWFYSQFYLGGIRYKKAQFYGKGENQSVRFFMALMRLFDEYWDDFDINNLQNYYFIFEPIIWFHNATVMSNNAGYWYDFNRGLKYSFYGTLTELAYIQLNSRYWGQNRVGFACVDTDSSGGNPRSVCGAWLDDMQVCSFVDGGAMMLRENKKLCDNEPVEVGVISSEFLYDYKNNKLSICNPESARPESGYDAYCYGDYVVQNMGIACLQYNPPITYTAKDYIYRTNTEVVTSIKLKNNSTSDFLPLYSEVAEAGYSGAEPVTLGAILEYTDESGNALSDAVKTELGLVDFVSVQGIGAEQNFKDLRSAGFESTPVNETYLYFKWKTPETPMKINITARFVGDSEKTPFYINNAADSIAGENIEYSGTNPEYLGKTFTTVTFTCDIQDKMNYIKENRVPPDTIGGFMDKPSPSAPLAEREKYNKNVEIYNNYNSAKSFNMYDYISAEIPERILEARWFEYSAQIPAFGSGVALEMNEYLFTYNKYGSGVSYLPDDVYMISPNVPTERRTVAGRTYLQIPSGYGFEVYFDVNDGGSSFGFRDKATLLQNGVVFYPEFNYSSDCISTVESRYNPDNNDLTWDYWYMLQHNKYSYYPEKEMDYDSPDRVHFVPIWFSDNGEYKIELVMFDCWTPVGQLYDHKTYTLYIDGNIYDNWYPTKSYVNQKK